jgi:hypothetical protein
MSVLRLNRRVGVTVTVAAGLLLTLVTGASSGATAHAVQGGSGDVMASIARSAVGTLPASLGGKTLGGFSSQNWPLVVALSGNEKQVSKVATGLMMRCTSGNSFPLEDGWTQLAIGRDGTTHGSMTVPPMSGASASISGGSDSLTAKLDRMHATMAGTWRLQLNFTMSGGQTDQCDSGVVRFTARL